MGLRNTVLAAALLQSSVAVRRTRNDEDIDLVITDATDANNTQAEFARKCSDTDLSPLAEKVTDLKLVGDGANGCVFIGNSVQHGNAKVAVKTSKMPGRLKVWKEECRLMQMLHTTACKKGAEQLDLVENYIPTCIDIFGTDDNPFLIMHAAGTTQIQDYTEIVKTDEDKKSVFVQLVASIHALHTMGLTHNDLHAKNVMLEETTGDDDAASHIHLALIDFGDVMPPKKRPNSASWTTGYKRDSFAIWRMGGNLADCEGAKHLRSTHVTLPAEVFEKCIKEKWNPGEDFMTVLKKLIQDTQTAAPNQHVSELYETEFVQKHLPALKQYYQLLDRESCSGAGVLDSAKPYNGTGAVPATDNSSDTPAADGDKLPISTIEERSECKELCRWCPKKTPSMYACHSGNAVKQCSQARDRWLSADCGGICLCRGTKDEEETEETTKTTTAEEATTKSTTTEEEEEETTKTTTAEKDEEDTTKTATTTTSGNGARKLATLPALLLACLTIFRKD
eukprot:TRINITY_DN1914_c0_g5_i1.p1 TRINITY_DN1914_c0_g5~~TRINITY_DN1914_c0_g5_i1.p1  ORF type:complete len:508 (+),score=161.68 TRINITY_DN1914_c0_g5_i1:145-1668(+)